MTSSSPLRSSLYVIGIGGSGAKCLEAIVQMAATGLIPLEKLYTLFVDADESNGNLERAKQIQGNYETCYQRLKSTPQTAAWMGTEVKNYGVWSPFGTTRKEKKLNSLFLKSSMQTTLGHLFDVLYTPSEQNADLDVGFRGRPAIGAAVMSQINLDRMDEPPWSSFMNDIRQDSGAGRQIRIFLCGSIFGGTGASGLPTIAKLIAEKLEEPRKNGKVYIGGLFLLPYFQFSPVGIDTDEVFARSENFLINTEAALRYYATEAEAIFDKVYLLGNENRANLSFNIGKSGQKNAPHFLELYAALAAQHFLRDTPNTVGLIGRNTIGRLEWADLPNVAEVRQRLSQMVRFAYVWLDSIIPEFNLARSVGIKQYNKIPWFPKFFKAPPGLAGLFKGENNLPDFSSHEEQQSIQTIESWCKDFLQWVYEIHVSEGETIQLFLRGAIKDLGNKKGEFLNCLIDQDGRDAVALKRDTVQNILEQLEDRSRDLADNEKGTIGLAKVLYELCRL